MLGLYGTEGVRTVAYRVDSDPRLAAVVRWARTRLAGLDTDPLTISPGLAGQLATQLSAVADQRPSVLRELGLTALQLWQAHAGTTREPEAGELTVLFTDISGFSDWTLRVGDDTAVWGLRQISAAIEPLITAEGTLIKRLGDGLMAVFSRPEAAVAAAVAARDAVAELDLRGHRLPLRAGIHTGRPTPLGGDYYGRDVNIAARLTETAGPGEVCLSETTRRQLPEHGWRPQRQRTVHAPGVPEQLTAHTIAAHDDDLPPAPLGGQPS